MEKNTNAQDAYNKKRAQRVQRMRKSIIVILAIMLIIPTFICILLAVKVSSMQKQIDYLYEAKFSNGVVASNDDKIKLSNSEFEVSLIKAGSNSISSQFDNKSITVNKDKAQEKQKVYLTFDDGPSKYTSQIISILEKYGVKATFFVIGNENEDIQELYKEILDSGNAIALHSYSHQYSKVYNSVADFKEDFYKIQDLVYELTGVTVKTYRFPGGSSNQVSNIDMAEFIKFLNSEGVVYYDWNVANGDSTSKQYTANELVNNVINGLPEEGDAIVLMHDTNAKGTTVESLPKLIEKLKEMDVEFAVIDKNTKAVQHIQADSVKN